MTRRRRLLLVAAVLLAGCDGGDDEPAAPADGSTTTTATPTTTGPGVQLAQTCTARRYEVRYPQGWSANRGDVAPPCRFFDPEPFTVPAATEVVGLAVIFDVESVPYAVVRDGAGAPVEDILDRQDVKVDGRRAVRFEARELDGAFVPVGTRSLRYVVDLGDATLVALTYGLKDAAWDRNRAVLEAMIGSVEILASAECSAAGLSASPAPGDLPAPVAEMRQKIVAAATACDFAGLAALATPGTFTYSFGQRGDPASAWRASETEGTPVLRILVQLMNRPFASRPVGPQTQYLWPRAYAYDRWSEVPAEARDELAPIYGPPDFENFERFGSYSGYRVGITGGGDWQFFVGGD